MKEYFYSIYHTKAFVSNFLERIFFHGVFLLVVILFFIAISLVSYIIGNINLIIVLGFSLVYIYTVLHLFIRVKLRSTQDALIMERNYAEMFGYDLAQTLIEYFPKPLKYIHLVRAISRSQRGQTILGYMGLEPSEFFSRLKALHIDHNPNLLPLDEFMARVRYVQAQWEEPRLEANILLYVLFEQGDLFTNLLNQLDLSAEDFFNIVKWEALHYHNSSRIPVFSPLGLQKNFGSFGRSWTIGYTNDLDLITEDISQKIKYRDPHRVIIHQDILRLMLTSLSKSNRNNLLLLGGVGVGKSSLVENLAYMIRQYQLNNNQHLSRVLALKTTDLFSGMTNGADYLFKALQYAEGSGNIILVIENISELFIATDETIRNILLKFLHSSRINVIGLDDPEGYHRGVKIFPVIDSLFESIPIPDSTDEETMNVLMMEAFDLAIHSQRIITYQSLRAIMHFSHRYLSKGGFPGKAVEILSDAVNQAVVESSPFVLESHIRNLVSQRTHINLNELNTTEKDILLSLEEKLQLEIKGQAEALTSVVNALKRAQLDLKSRNKPVGTFLFLGPTGVGKTETAKALAKHYFGSIDRMIRVDMNEFGNQESVYGILGAPVGQDYSNQEGFLTKKIQDRPFSLILLDEIEKAHPQVLNIFLQILDEGFLLDNRGIKTDFRNAIIIATSNAGALFMRNFIQQNANFDKASFKMQLVDTLIKGKEFSPEFINRFTEVIVYYPLSLDTVREIAEKIIEHLIDRFLQERGVELKISAEAVDFLAQKGYSQDFGARELERTVSTILETFLADYLLLHQVQRGDKISVSAEDLSIVK